MASKSSPSVKKMNSRGAFIAFEGIDRSGKSTQAQLLARKLEAENIKVQHIRFPERTTPCGLLIDDYLRTKKELRDEVIHLLFSANRWEMSSQIEQWLDEGITVIADRYLYSGITYSAAKGLPFTWCCAPDEGLLAPDLVLYFDIDPALASNRGEYGGERYERLEFQNEVRRQYKKLICPSHWTTIDASADVESLAIEVNKVVNPLLENCLSGLIGQRTFSSRIY